MVLFVVLLQINFLQRKQSREANVTSHAFQQVSNLDFFSEFFRGPLKTFWRATACSPQACSWTTLA